MAILLALPRLFWGETGANDAPAAFVLPLPMNLEQTGWGRNLHFLAGWILVLNGVALPRTRRSSAGICAARSFRTATRLRPSHLAREMPTMPASGGARARDALRYNALQKLAYLVVIFILFPLMVLTGLTMSPGVTAAYPELFTLFGGRQSARTMHFLAACLLVLFLVVHVGQVFVDRRRAT